MKTWLLTWNMAHWAWAGQLDGYKELINDISQIGHAYCKWTCGNTKSIQPGDRIFLVKLGSAPRGIVASGHAATGVFEGQHWNPQKNSEGKRAKRIFVDFDRILDCESEPILEMDALKLLAPSFRWSPQASGIEIPESVAQLLESAWSTL